MTKTVDLKMLTKGKTRTLAGHERGLNARAFFNLDLLDDDSDTVLVVFPDDFDAIATSFFQGMFSESYKKLGDHFTKHYEFLPKRESLLAQVQRGLSRIKASSNPRSF